MDVLDVSHISGFFHFHARKFPLSANLVATRAPVTHRDFFLLSSNHLLQMGVC